MLMPKYQKLIAKIQTIKNFRALKENSYPNYNAGILDQSELEMILDALETLQFLEIVFKARRIAENEKP